MNSRSSLAATATLHCLTGCAIGEVVGLMIGTAFGLGNAITIALAVGLAFLFGYTLSTLPLIQAGLGFFRALRVVFAADTLSIAVMEIVDNLVMALVPGAMDAGLVNPVFWLAMMIALTAAFIAAFPVNRRLIDKGKGHALTHQFMHGDGHNIGDSEHDTAPSHQKRHEAHAHEAPPEHLDAGADQSRDQPGSGTSPTDPRTPRPRAWSFLMNTNTLAAGVVGFLLGGLTVSIAAELENDEDPRPAHRSSIHQSIDR